MVCWMSIWRWKSRKVRKDRDGASFSSERAKNPAVAVEEPYARAWVIDGGLSLCRDVLWLARRNTDIRNNMAVGEMREGNRRCSL